MNWKNVLTAKRSSLPAPRKEESKVKLDQPAAKPDGRFDREKGRGKVFSTRVSQTFINQLDAARSVLAKAEGASITDMSRPEFMERMLALWVEQKDGKQIPFGLTQKALTLAELIAEHVGTDDLGGVLEDALAVRAAQFGLLKRSGTK